MTGIGEEAETLLQLVRTNRTNSACGLQGSEGTA